MKKSHIFGVVIIGIAIMVMISTAGDASSYLNFQEAKVLYDDGNNDKIHVAGTLKRDNQGDPIGLVTSPDKLSFSFQMIDSNGLEQQVIFNEPVPADFLMSQQVVVVGAYHNETFVASKIQFKCPSKYQDETVEIGSL